MNKKGRTSSRPPSEGAPRKGLIDAARIRAGPVAFFTNAFSAPAQITSFRAAFVSSSRAESPISPLHTCASVNLQVGEASRQRPRAQTDECTMVRV